jgi:tRNA (adenine-N(1)-)-methyltransferase non-catalytic subunit
MIGAPYGSIFEVRDRRLVRITDASFSFDDALSAGGAGGDNSGYTDTNTAQKLTECDIMSLKEEGATGEDIIRSLVENSETWASKTSYAQEKWLKRKAKK